MICEICKQNRIDTIIAEAKKAMERYTNKLKEENNAIQRNINKTRKNNIIHS